MIYTGNVMREPYKRNNNAALHNKFLIIIRPGPLSYSNTKMTKFNPFCGDTVKMFFFF
jgi:hypothetical protein